MRTVSSLALGVLCLSGVLSANQAGQAAPTAPLNVHVFTVIAATGTVIPIDQPVRVESVKHVANSLKGKLPKRIAVLANEAGQADLTVEVLGRKADGDDIVLHLRVTPADGKAFTVDGLNDDGHWNDAGNDGAKRIVEWLKLNEGNIEALRRR